MKKVQPNADYDKVTMVGHSMGGDISMYFAKQYPDEIKKVVTLDNLRVPFLTDGKFKILSFRSKDPQFKTDPGVIPDDEQCEKAGITVVNTSFQHNDMRDTGPDAAKNSIQSHARQIPRRYRQERCSQPVTPRAPDILTASPGPVPLSVPLASKSDAEQDRRELRQPSVVGLRHRPGALTAAGAPSHIELAAYPRALMAGEPIKPKSAGDVASAKGRGPQRRSVAGGADRRRRKTSPPSSPKRARCRRIGRAPGAGWCLRSTPP